MKTIGLIGGMSWESTADYYRRLNELVKQRLGGLHSAKIVLHSVDFAEIEALQANGAWMEAGLQLAKVARSLEAGALLAASDLLALRPSGGLPPSRADALVGRRLRQRAYAIRPRPGR